MQLPIHTLRQSVSDAFRLQSRVLIQAPTGSGKSTQVPQFLLDDGLAGDGEILVLQPRRLPARMLAARVASERGQRLGDQVGYQIRLDRVDSPATRIRFVTEGVLLRRMLGDRRLSGVSILVFDEFHERHLDSDLSLALACSLQETHRPDLRIVVMSATLDAAGLQAYLGECAVLASEGRMFPVEVSYLSREPGEAPVWELAAEAVRDSFESHPGNVLVFMPGAYEIQRTVQAVRQVLGGGIPVLALHGEMPAAEQDAAVEPARGRKVIVSTNVAETSLTIDGVTAVIDSGLARMACFDPRRGINTLRVEKISRASAEQRAGRAGRTAPGRCIRLWTARDQERRALRNEPEVRRVDLADAALTLKAAAVDDVAGFRWIDPPETQSLDRALTLLADLGAIASPSGPITDLGRRMLAFPVHPRYARMFLAAEGLGCVRAVALVSALTQTRSLLLRAERRVAEERADLLGGGRSDFGVLMRAFSYADRNQYRVDACRRFAIHADAARQAGRLFRQFLEIAERQGLTVETSAAPDEALARCILAGFSDHVACRRDEGTLQCDVVHGRRGVLDRESVAQDGRLLVAAEIEEIESGSGGVRTRIGLATVIEEEWLAELFPADFSSDSTVEFDAAQKRVVERRETRFRDLVIESRARDAEPSAMVSACLASEVIKGRLVLTEWGDAVEQFLHRVRVIAERMPELGIAAVTDGDREILVAQVCDGATAYREIKNRPVMESVRAWLTATQRGELDRHVPERIELPGGKRLKLDYSEGHPVLRARIQELYTVERLAVCRGRVPVTVHILAPNQRPIQVTQDLSKFWREDYPKVKAELQRRYPRHEWR